MSNETTARTPSGVPAGGEFAVTERAHADVTLEAVPVSAAAAAWIDASRRADEANVVIARASTNLIATAVLRECPGAAYLNLDEEDTEYGPRVRSGAVLAADGSVLIGYLDDDDGTVLGTLSQQVDDLLVGLSGLSMAEGSPAVDDPMVRNADGSMGNYHQHRIDLKAAAALYPSGPPAPDQTRQPANLVTTKHPSGAVVHVYVGDDGAIVVDFDTSSLLAGQTVRVNVNDGAVYDGDPELD